MTDDNDIGGGFIMQFERIWSLKRSRALCALNRFLASIRFKVPTKAAIFRQGCWAPNTHSPARGAPAVAEDVQKNYRKFLVKTAGIMTLWMKKRKRRQLWQGHKGESAQRIKRERERDYCDFSFLFIIYWIFQLLFELLNYFGSF